jgi:hypothetical protein
MVWQRICRALAVSITCLLPVVACTTSPFAARERVAPPRPPLIEPPAIYVGARPLHHRVRTVTLLPGERMAIMNVPADAGRVIPPEAVRHGSDVFTLAITHGTRVTADAGTVIREKDSGRTTAYIAPKKAGTYHMTLTRADGRDADLAVFVLTPLTSKRNGKIAGYTIGDYPEEVGMRADGKRAARSLRGFVEVTRANEETRLSQHFRLRDLACKQQPEHSPKYLMVDVRLLDKLEQLVDRLHARGRQVRGLAVMSAYRTPHYNSAIGNETIWSRHTTGDAADVFVDDDGNGEMDDLDGDGKVTVKDARWLLELVEELDENPQLAGGASAYPATSAHGPFVHVDARGYRARW